MDSTDTTAETAAGRATQSGAIGQRDGMPHSSRRDPPVGTPRLRPRKARSAIYFRCRSYFSMRVRTLSRAHQPRRRADFLSRPGPFLSEGSPASAFASANRQ